jgi:hypothetical protein
LKQRRIQANIGVTIGEVTMPVFPNTPEFQNLKTQFLLAIEAESATHKAILRLADLPGSKESKMAAIANATKDMEDAHSHKMAIWEKMQVIRRDKP